MSLAEGKSPRSLGGSSTIGCRLCWKHSRYPPCHTSWANVSNVLKNILCLLNWKFYATKFINFQAEIHPERGSHCQHRNRPSIYARTIFRDPPWPWFFVVLFDTGIPSNPIFPISLMPDNQNLAYQSQFLLSVAIFLKPTFRYWGIFSLFRTVTRLLFKNAIDTWRDV